jgi:hypothetical protein
MTYFISNQIQILHTEDEWDYLFTTDEYGTVDVAFRETSQVGKTSILIPKDCIQHFIDALEQLK